LRRTCRRCTAASARSKSATLCDPGVRLALEREGIELVRFSDLSRIERSLPQP
jgi:hypothetical protein